MVNPTYRGSNSQTSPASSGAVTKSKKVDYTEKIGNLEKRTDEISEDLGKLEKNIDRFQNVTGYVVVGMIIVFTIAAVTVGIEYFVGNDDRYEGFVEKTIENQKEFYTKKEVDEKLNNFKSCLAAGGWTVCLTQ